MTTEKIPSLFAFLVSSPRMKRAVLICIFMQNIARKTNLKNIPGIFGGNQRHEANRIAKIFG